MSDDSLVERLAELFNYYTNNPKAKSHEIMAAFLRAKVDPNFGIPVFERIFHSFSHDYSYIHHYSAYNIPIELALQATITIGHHLGDEKDRIYALQSSNYAVGLWNAGEFGGYQDLNEVVDFVSTGLDIRKRTRMSLESLLSLTKALTDFSDNYLRAIKRADELAIATDVETAIFLVEEFKSATKGVSGRYAERQYGTISGRLKYLEMDEVPKAVLTVLDAVSNKNEIIKYVYAKDLISTFGAFGYLDAEGIAAATIQALDLMNIEGMNRAKLTSALVEAEQKLYETTAYYRKTERYKRLNSAKLTLGNAIPKFFNDPPRYLEEQELYETLTPGAIVAEAKEILALHDQIKSLQISLTSMAKPHLKQ